MPPDASSFTPRPGLPRAVEVPLAAIGLIALSPLLLLAGLAIMIDSPGGPIYQHPRMGRRGRPFLLYKLRSMRTDAGGPELTGRVDPRITPVGRLLRRAKIDEIPQLWNVILGDMSLVGPRPESPRYANLEDPRWQRVLQVRPGITDPLTLRLRDEETVIPFEADERERFYLETLQPWKLEGYLDYLARRTPVSDMGVLLATLVAIVRPPPAPDPEELSRRGKV